MKNYKEMANDVFCRIDEYEKKQKRKRQLIIRTVTSLSCVCLAVLVGFGLWKGGFLNLPTTQMARDAIYPGIKDTIGEREEKSSGKTTTDNKIVVCPIDSYSAAKMNIGLKCDDFIKMDREAMNDYYGVNVVPSVPADLKEWENQSYGIYMRDGGTGEVYYDGNVLNFSNEDISRSVNLEIKKGSMPISCYAFFDSIKEKSTINNTEVAIGQTPDGYYHAGFMYHDVGFQLIANGITQDELVAVISSIIE